MLVIWQHLLVDVQVTHSVSLCGMTGCRNRRVRVQPSVSGHGDVTLASQRLSSGLQAWRLGSQACSTSGGPEVRNIVMQKHADVFISNDVFPGFVSLQAKPSVFIWISDDSCFICRPIKVKVFTKSFPKHRNVKGQNVDNHVEVDVTSIRSA